MRTSRTRQRAAFGGSLRVLMEIWGSCQVEGEVFRRRLEGAIASMREAGRIWQEGQRGRQLAEDRALADWSEYMRATGSRRTR